MGKRKPLRVGKPVPPVKERRVDDVGSKASKNVAGAGGTSRKPPATDDDDDDDDDEDDDKAKKGDDDEDDDDDNDDEDDDEDEDIALEGQLHVTEQITFEFNDPKEEYAESITVLLKKFIQNPSKAYALASRIATQDIVGTVVACEGGLDTFAFATVLPLTKQKVLSSAA